MPGRLKQKKKNTYANFDFAALLTRGLFKEERNHLFSSWDEISYTYIIVANNC